jgi:hypothetical protein
MTNPRMLLLSTLRTQTSAYKLWIEKGGRADSMFRVAPVLKEQIQAGKINLRAIINTHQYVLEFVNRDRNIY